MTGLPFLALASHQLYFLLVKSRVPPFAERVFSAANVECFTTCGAARTYATLAWLSVLAMSIGSVGGHRGMQDFNLVGGVVSMLILAVFDAELAVSRDAVGLLGLGGTVVVGLAMLVGRYRGQTAAAHPAKISPCLRYCSSIPTLLLALLNLYQVAVVNAISHIPKPTLTCQTGCGSVRVFACLFWSLQLVLACAMLIRGEEVARPMATAKTLVGAGLAQLHHRGAVAPAVGLLGAYEVMCGVMLLAACRPKKGKGKGGKGKGKSKKSGGDKREKRRAAAKTE